MRALPRPTARAGSSRDVERVVEAALAVFALPLVLLGVDMRI
jgi:hypothetical protein